MGWRVKPLKDQFKDAAAGTGAVGFMMLSICSFLPIQIAAACVLFGVFYAWNAIAPLVTTRHIPIRNHKGTDPSPEILAMGAILAKRLNMKVAPAISEVPDSVAQLTTLGARRVKTASAEDLALVAGNYAVAHLNLNRIEYSESFKKRMLQGHPNKLIFAIAHETAHLAADDVRSPRIYAQQVMKYSAGTSIAASFAGVFLYLITDEPNIIFSGEPQNLPMMVGQTLIGLELATYCLRYSSRLGEYRADRNAVYATQDPEAAKDTLRLLGDGFNKKTGLFAPITNLYQKLHSTHPPIEDRIKAIDKAWADMSKAPKP